MKLADLNLSVIAGYDGRVHQVILNKHDSEHLKNFLMNLFISTGRSFELMEKSIEGFELRKVDHE